jgi:hypothetical protein
MTTKKLKKLSITRQTMATVAGGPGHRTTGRCTNNGWQTCYSHCCVSWISCAATCEGGYTCGTCSQDCP